MTYPTITPLPDAPSRSQSPDDFSSTADTFVAALPDLVTDVNAAGAYIDEKTISIGNDFQGAYSAGTTYTTGQSVLYSSLFYLSLVDSNTGNTPDSSPSEWVEIAGAASGDGGVSGINTQVFTSSGTYTPTIDYTYAIVYVTGGGGGGSQAGNTGGGGGTAIKTVDLSTITSETVTIGAGGATGNPASSGGTSSFGSIASASGGGGGGSSTGAGGIGSGGDVNLRGEGGSVGPADPGPSGGSSFWGGGARGAFAGSGSQGGGGSYYGSGGAGIVVVMEYK